MTNTKDSTAIEIPPAADDARGMANRIVAIASALDDLVIKPSHLQCSNGYLNGLPEVERWPGYPLQAPFAEDMVSAQVKPADLDRLAALWSLSILEPNPEPGDVPIRYASGVVNGVAVKVYAGVSS